MKLTMILAIVCQFLFALSSHAQRQIKSDSTTYELIGRPLIIVNKCTPWDHVKCIYLTGTEVYRAGREGEKTRHWWRMSYIGQACTEQYGTFFGKIFEGLFVVPHYTGVALGNGMGLVVYAIRGPKNK